MLVETLHHPFIFYHNSDLLRIHFEAGLSIQKGRKPFIDESNVENYLTGNSSLILLDVGEKQLPAVRGLNAAIEKFDAITQYLDSNNYELREFQAAVEFRGPYTDPYSNVKSELVGDKLSFRLQTLDALIKRWQTTDLHVAENIRRLRYSLQQGFNFDGLRVGYGNPREDIADAVPSCVNGLFGTVREAAIAYAADPNIKIIGLYPYLNSSSARLGIPPPRGDQIVKGVTINVHDREDHDEIKLLVDGVLADNHLEDILGLDWIPYMAIGLLEYARGEGIRKVIINAGNSSSHESVNAFQYFMATKYLGLQPDRDFTFDLDPDTGNHVFRLRTQHIRNSVDGFPYTHHLEKDPMPKEMVEALAAHSIYRGESYLETWWAWMTHLNSGRDAWDSELKARFPYAEQRYPVMKPSWNLGRGPMKGMEVEVTSVLAKLHQEYL